MHPIETGNIVLIIVGAIMVVSGPIIVYNVVKGVLDIRRADAKGDIQTFNVITNVVIAVILFFAGILFIVNNLRGNPLHFKSQTQTESLVR